MKVESKLFLYLVPPFLAFLALYVFMTSRDTVMGFEVIGAICLFLTALLFAMVGFYLHATAKKLPARPEDNPRADIAEAEGDYGYFVASSWTPLWLAGASAVLFMGLAIGWWMVALGVALAVPAVILWVFESFSGEHSI